MEETKEENVTFVEGWRCEFCGEIYKTKEEALLCWNRHIQFEIEPYFTLNDEFPTEVLVKKIEGNRYTEIATYELKKKEKVDLPRKETVEYGSEEH